MPSPILDQKKIGQLKRLLRSGPRTVAELQTRLGVGQKTVYRYLKLVEEQIDDQVVRVGSARPAQFRIVKS